MFSFYFHGYQDRTLNYLRCKILAFWVSIFKRSRNDLAGAWLMLASEDKSWIVTPIFSGRLPVTVFKTLNDRRSDFFFEKHIDVLRLPAVFNTSTCYRPHSHSVWTSHSRLTVIEISLFTRKVKKIVWLADSPLGNFLKLNSFKKLQTPHAVSHATLSANFVFLMSFRVHYVPSLGVWSNREWSLLIRKTEKL